jgi:hypothetical protein
MIALSLKSRAMEVVYMRLKSPAQVTKKDMAGHRMTRKITDGNLPLSKLQRLHT